MATFKKLLPCKSSSLSIFCFSSSPYSLSSSETSQSKQQWQRQRRELACSKQLGIFLENTGGCWVILQNRNLAGQEFLQQCVSMRNLSMVQTQDLKSLVSMQRCTLEARAHLLSRRKFQWWVWLPRHCLHIQVSKRASWSAENTISLD